MTDAEILRMVAADRWRECAPADLARLTSTGHLSCGHLLTNAGRQFIGLRPIKGLNPDAKGVPQYAK